MEYPFIIGTAGHIDHGKTSLVRVLTGVDCDRLEEEKRRGITIELGFAPLSLAGGRVVSIVDVPGHERFIRQMAAGAAGVDAAMLIVAASEGVMPQTREHLDILNLLGVRCGLVVLTKRDLVDEETLEIASSEVAELIRGSCLSEAAVIPVSSVTGEGVSEVLAEIERLVGRVAPKRDFGAFFLPVDRVFSKKGFGCVVTGTVYQGGVSEGDEVELMPWGGVGKVRFLHAHGAKVGSVRAGQRAAINLSGVSLDRVERGDVVCARGAFIPTSCMSAWVEMLPSAREGLVHWQRVRLHVGTADVAARVSLLRLGGGERSRGYLPGSGGPVQILTESKITVVAGQRFVIRFYSPLVTIGGGRVMLPNATLARNRAEREVKAETVSGLAVSMNNADFSPASFLAALICDRGILSAVSLFELSQMDKGSFAGCLDELAGKLDVYGVFEFGKSRVFISGAAFDRVAMAVRQMLGRFHAEHPELAGLDGDKLYASLDVVGHSEKVSAGDFKELVVIMAAKGVVASAAIQGRVCYRAVDFCHSPDDKFMTVVETVRAALKDASFNLLTETELEEKTKLSPSDIKSVAVYLREQDDLRMIKDGLLFSREMRDKLLVVLAAMKEDITVASLRDQIGVSRKYTLAMLEFLDSQGLTKRIGDKRVLVG